MKCKKLNKRLYFYHYGLLNLFQKKVVENHLKKCLECQKEYKLIQYKTEVFDVGMAEEDVRKHLDNRILERVNQTGKQNISSKLRYSVPISFRIGFAFLFLFIISFAAYYWSGLKNEIGNVKIVNSIVINNRIVKGNKKLYKNAKLFIPGDAQAVITKKNRYCMKLYANTKFFISRKRETATYIKMDSGATYFNIDKNIKGMKIETINSIIEIAGTKFKLIVSKEEVTTIIEINRGNIVTWNKLLPDKTISGKTGDTIIIAKGNIPLVVEPEKQKPIEKTKKVDIFKERIFLRDGNIIIGNIIKQNEEDIEIKTKAGILRFNNRDIEKIEYINKTNNPSIDF